MPKLLTILGVNAVNAVCLQSVNDLRISDLLVPCNKIQYVMLLLIRWAKSRLYICDCEYIYEQLF